MNQIKQFLLLLLAVWFISVVGLSLYLGLYSLWRLLSDWFA